MVGVDTLKIVGRYSGRGFVDLLDRGLESGKKHGSLGVVWWREMLHPVLGRVVYKWASPACGYLMWEGSLPKMLGTPLAPCGQEDVQALADAFVEDLDDCLEDVHFSRVDACLDLPDPGGSLRAAAVGWAPHPRARYVQAVYQETETVFLRNGSRGIRVYDKYKESGSEDARDLTRLEYQLRSDWCKRSGLDVLSPSWYSNLQEVLEPLTESLTARQKEMIGNGACTDHRDLSR